MSIFWCIERRRLFCVGSETEHVLCSLGDGNSFGKVGNGSYLNFYCNRSWKYE